MPCAGSTTSLVSTCAVSFSWATGAALAADFVSFVSLVSFVSQKEDVSLVSLAEPDEPLVGVAPASSVGEESTGFELSAAAGADDFLPFFACATGLSPAKVVRQSRIASERAVVMSVLRKRLVQAMTTGTPRRRGRRSRRPLPTVPGCG